MEADASEGHMPGEETSASPAASPQPWWIGPRIKDRDPDAEWLKWSKCRAMAHVILTDPEATDAERAANHTTFLNSFYPTRHSTPIDIAKVRAICDHCAVRIDCLASSLVYWEKVGIWGGQTEQERRETRKRMDAAGVGENMETAVPWLDSEYGE